MKSITVIDAMRKKGKTILITPSIYAGSRQDLNQIGISPVQIRLLPQDAAVAFVVLAFCQDDYNKVKDEIEKEVSL